jgi:hypothetical protein
MPGAITACRRLEIAQRAAEARTVSHCGKNQQAPKEALAGGPRREGSQQVLLAELNLGGAQRKRMGW